MGCCRGTHIQPPQDFSDIFLFFAERTLSMNIPAVKQAPGTPLVIPDEVLAPLREAQLRGDPISPAQERFLKATKIPPDVNTCLGLGKDKERSNFLETMNKVTGTKDEAAKQSVKDTGTLINAESEVDAKFAKTIADSPAVNTFYGLRFPVHLYRADRSFHDPEIAVVCQRWIEILKNHLNKGTLYGEDGKLNPDLVHGELAEAKYWGLMVGKEYGGLGASMSDVATVIRKISLYEPTVAGLASINGCIGVVYPVSQFGTKEQKERFLPDIAQGKVLSAFALTERQAGSDLNRPEALIRIEGNDAVINGQKLFISNANYGGRIALVAMDENYKLRELSGQLTKGEGKKMVVAIVDLPPHANENFKILRYEINALRRLNNVGLWFQEFRIPKENILIWDADGPGATATKGINIAYMGLNRGRVALCANAAGSLMALVGSMLPWCEKRISMGMPIAKRDTVQERIGLTASYAVVAKHLADFTAELLDKNYRPEIECEVAKIFGSERQKEVAIEYVMKTEGGRFFLKGHPVGDNLHDVLAPCIYEGEGTMLLLHVMANLMNPQIAMNPRAVGSVARAVIPETFVNLGNLSEVHKDFRRYVTFALRSIDQVSRNMLLNKMPLEAIRMLNKMAKGWLIPFGKDPDLQNSFCLLRNRGEVVVNAIAMLVTAVRASQHSEGTDAEIKLEHKLARVALEKLKFDIAGGGFKKRDHVSFKAASAGRALIHGVNDGSITWFDGFPLPEILQDYVDVKPPRRQKPSK